MNVKKALFYTYLSDALLDLCYYNRKSSDELTVAEVEKLLESGEVTLPDIQEEVAKFFTNSFKLPEAIPDLRHD